MRLIGKVILYVLAISAFTIHLILWSHVTRLKGSTIGGHQKDGRFFVSNKGLYHEVSEFDWRTLERAERAAVVATIAFVAYGFVFHAVGNRSTKSLE